MKKLSVYVLVALVLLIAGCASTSPSDGTTSAPPLLTAAKHTLESVCALWSSTVKPLYPEVRQLARDHWNSISPNLQEKFLLIDSQATTIDKNVTLLCDLANGADVAHNVDIERGRVPWDKIGSALIDVASFALQAKVQGKF